MPRKYIKRRVYKKRRTLRKGNIFKNKSAKSQAKQIYALNKKINYIEKKTRPETLVCQTVFVNQLFTVDGQLGSYGLAEWHQRYFIYEEKLFGTIENGGCGYHMVGSMLRPYNITISGLFENKNHTAEIGGKVYDSIPMTGYLRIIVGKLYGGNQGRYPAQITKPYGNTPDIGLICGPLINDVSASMKIIRNKVIKIDSQRDTRMFKIKIRNPGTYRKGVDQGGASIPAYKNEYIMYIQYYAPDQLFSDGYTGLQPVAPIHRLTSGIKFVFTDN